MKLQVLRGLAAVRAPRSERQVRAHSGSSKFVLRALAACEIL